jgi:site-specific DNA-methyltransferase (adenine-specific)
VPQGAAEAKGGATGAYQRASSGFMGKQWDGGDIAFQPATWAAVLRVLKPGGYLLAFASTRGFGRMSVAIEDAGFITHPLIAWVFGSGFPKATRIKADGYDGFRYGGQALKPAIEPIYMGQKPFSEANGTANILTARNWRAEHRRLPRWTEDNQNGACRQRLRLHCWR